MISKPRNPVKDKEIIRYAFHEVYSIKTFSLKLILFYFTLIVVGDLSFVLFFSLPYQLKSIITSINY